MMDLEPAAIGHGSNGDQAFGYQDHPNVAQMQVGNDRIDRQGRPAEWQAQAMPAEAPPPSYKEVTQA